MQPWGSPAEELESLRRAAAQARCSVRFTTEQETPHGRRTLGRVTCEDGWGAARMLVALSLEDASTPQARMIALALRAQSSGDLDFARKVLEYVRSRVAFVREHGEVFARSDYTLATGAGDCDDHARVVFTLLRAGGLPARLAFLHRPGGPPRHVVAQAGIGGRWYWLETTIAADFGEEPYAAARRLGVDGARQDIATEVRTMTEKDLAPLPAGFDGRTSPDQFALDVAALESLGFLCDASPATAPSSPAFREAVRRFQASRAGVTVDGLIGPQTRGALLAALPSDELGMAYMAALSSPRLTAHLSPLFFRGVREMVEAFRARGATASGEDFLKVWNVESGINPAKPNALGAPYLGLNQMGPSERRAAGFDGSPEDWLALEAHEQLPYVRRFYEAKDVSALRDAASVYLVNFLPAYASHAGDPSFVLARRKDDAPAVDAPESEWAAYRAANRGDWYAWNRSFDAGRKGWISVGDLKPAAEAGGRGAYWDEVRTRYYAESGDSPSSGGASGAGAAVAILLVAGTAIAAWMAARG